MLRIKIVNERQRKQVTLRGNRCVLGRAPGQGRECVQIQDPWVSRQQLRVEELATGEAAIENIGRASVKLDQGDVLEHGRLVRLKLPLRMRIGQTELQLTSCDRATQSWLGQPQLADIRHSALFERTLDQLIAKPIDNGERACISELGETPSPAMLAKWFETILSVHRSAAGSEAFYEETANAVVELVGLDRGLVLLYHGDEWVAKAFCTTRGGEEVSFSRSVLNRVVADKRTFFDLSSAGLVTASLQNIEAVVASPILGPQNRVLGAVYGSRDVSLGGTTIRPLEVQFVQLLASAVAGGLTRMEQQRQLLKYENELAIGRLIQNSFLPSTVPLPAGWDVAARFLPAEEVAGDFYDVFPLSESDWLVIVIADVCDKGVGAALYMALVRTLVRAFTTASCEAHGERPQPDVRAIAEMVNRYVIQNHGETSMFATLFLGLLDTRSARLDFVNAGHTPPLVVRAGGAWERIDSTGPAVGMFADAAFEQDDLTLGPGDVLLLLTDGITEARNTAGDFYGDGRLAGLATESVVGAHDLIARIEQDVRQFIGDADQADDITMLVVSRRDRS